MPCRTIRQASDNASDGDKIEVGPGVYGNVNGDSDYDDPGEEGETGPLTCECAVNLDKQVDLVSAAGAAATVIEGIFSGVNPRGVVRIESDGARLGRPKRGFTVTGGLGFATGGGVFVVASDVTVEGNVARDCTAPGFASVGLQILFRHNLAVANNDDGFYLQGAGHTVKNNWVCRATDLSGARSPGILLKMALFCPRGRRYSCLYVSQNNRFRGVVCQALAIGRPRLSLPETPSARFS